MTVLRSINGMNPIPGFAGYFATAEGEIISTRGRWNAGKPTPLKARPRADGYLVVSPAPGKPCLVHALVLAAFKGPKPAGMQCCHNDGIRTNNRIENLRYDTIRNNAQDRNLHGTMYSGERHHYAKLSRLQVDEIFAAKGREPSPSLAVRFGVTTRTIFNIWAQETWRVPSNFSA